MTRPPAPEATPARAPRRRRRALGLAASAVLVGASLAGRADANSGNIYGFHPDTATGHAPFSLTASGLTGRLTGGAGTYHAGTGATLAWTCRPGTEIAYVAWLGSRTAAPSHLEAVVTFDGFRQWSEPDASMPVEPQRRQHVVSSLPGRCRATLNLRQTETRAQHARAYVLHDAHVALRDLTPPTVTITDVPAGWVNAQQVHVGWRASDNFGSDGIDLQRILIAGHPVWEGRPGAGDHRAPAALHGIPDGIHELSVHAAGDGTPAGAAATTVRIDRSAPAVNGMAVGYSGTPGRANLVWNVDDALSGVASSHVEVNVAGDGSQAAGWVEVAAAPGPGVKAFADVDVTGVPDGVHAWRVRTHDHAGNIGYTNGAGVLVVDTTPPAVALEPLPVGYVSELPLAFTITDQLQASLGVGPATVFANTATDGSASGTWTPLRVLTLGAGRHQLTVPLTQLADGRHALWMRAHNGPPFGGLVTDRFGEIKVDRTPPTITGARFELPSSGRLKVSWIADDSLSGLSVAVVQWREADGPWRTLGHEPLSDGAATITLDISALPPGGYDLRLLVADRAGNIAQATPPDQVRVDHAPPVVEGLRIADPATATLAWRQSDPGGGFGACPTAIEVSGPGTGSEWREILAERLGEGEHSRRLPLAGLAPGDYRVRVLACDAAGNVGSATIGPLRLDGAALSGAGSTAPDPFRRFRTARLTLDLAGARVQHRRGARPTLVRRVRFGQAVSVSGRLVARNGRPLARAEIEVRGRGGRVVGRATTGAKGRFRAAVRPDASGALRVGVPAGRQLLPRRPVRGLRVLVRPLVGLRASTRTPVVGAPVVFTGRIRPSPKRVRGPARKVVVLEWRDPLRGTWRPVVNARARADGTFRVTWRFALQNLTIPMRVRVPAEGRWPLLPVLSRPVSVTPRGV